MYKEMIPLHKTETIPIAAQAGNEWELVCNECSFRARFTRDPAHGENRLEILSPGDPQARHSGNQGSVRTSPEQAFASARLPRDNDEAWLTPELRQKLSEILQGLD